MAAPNIVNVTSIYGKTLGTALGTNADAAHITCPSNKVLKINSIIVSNVDGANSADVSIKFYDSSSATSYRIAHTVTVPADTSIVIIDKNSSIYLEESDQIRSGASVAGDLEMIISYEEIDDA
jgi:hypothetical protein